MAFKLSQRSLDRLDGVDADLIAVVKRAIELTDVDFGVTEGLRTLETQQKYVAAGKSQTLKSKHLEGKAVDLVAYVDGSVTWELNVYDNIADAMKQAAKELVVSLRLGAAWHINNICDYAGTMDAFLQYQIKIVMTSQSSAVVPKIKSLRTIAMAE